MWDLFIIIRQTFLSATYTMTRLALWDMEFYLWLKIIDWF